ncbi:MAG: 30S ribosomal protein S7 [Myxococcales bacterium]|nr:30S ribosomal protein S7 [Myxococcales bacterium]
MPRKHIVQKRHVEPDPKFNDWVAAKMISMIMREGKRSVAERIFYDSIELLEQRGKEEGLKLFKRAIENAKPQVEVKSRRVGGSTYQVPVEVRADRKLSLAMRWLISFAKKRNEKSMTEKLAGELLDASGNKGATIKKREDTHRMAEANKAFAHYRW